MDKHINDQKDAALSGSDSYRQNSLRFYSQMSAEFGRQNKEWMAQNQNNHDFAKGLHERLQAQEKVFAAHKQMDVNVRGDELKRLHPDLDSEFRRNDLFREQARGPFFMNRDMQLEGHFMSQLKQGAEQTSGSQRHILLAFSAGHEARLVEMTQGYARLRELEQEWFNDPNEVKPAGTKEAYPPLSNDVMQSNVGTPAECRLEALRQARIATRVEENDPAMVEAIFDNIKQNSRFANSVLEDDSIFEFQQSYDADNLAQEIHKARTELVGGESKTPAAQRMQEERERRHEELCRSNVAAGLPPDHIPERPEWSKQRAAQAREWLEARQQDTEKSKEPSHAEYGK